MATCYNDYVDRVAPEKQDFLTCLPRNPNQDNNYRRLSMPARLKISNGTRYGRWTLINEASNATNQDRRFECICDCGNKGIVRLADLRNGHSKSCGCFKIDLTTARNITHGLCISPHDKRIFNVWRNMMHRCYNLKNRRHKDWGGRGIKVCSEWHNPAVFVAWSKSNGYHDDLSIERIDNDKGYYPDNCKWATMKEQAQNRRGKKRND